MRKLCLVGLLLLGGCAVNQGHRDTVPVVADSTKHGGHEFENLALAAVIALLLVPALAKKKP